MLALRDDLFELLLRHTDPDGAQELLQLSRGHLYDVFGGELQFGIVFQIRGESVPWQILDLPQICGKNCRFATIRGKIHELP